MDALAEQVPAGSDGVVFLPYMAGERSPIWNPNASGVFFGLNYAKTRATPDPRRDGRRRLRPAA